MLSHAFPLIACQVLAEVCAKRKKAENEESNAVEYIKTLNEWFSQNGDPGETAGRDASDETRNLYNERLRIFQSKCTEFTRSCRARDGARFVLKWLAGKYDNVIELALQGRLKEGQLKDELGKLMGDAPTLPLFSIKPDEVPDPANAKIGEPVQTAVNPEKFRTKASAVPTENTGPHDTDLDAKQLKLEANETPLESLELDGKSARALRDSGFITLGHIARHFREDAGNCRLTKIGVTGKDELKIEGAVRLAREGLNPLGHAKDPSRKPSKKTKSAKA